MADIIIDGTTVINKTGDTITQTFPGPNHTFIVKALNQPISGATNSTNDNANSDQLAIYNGSTKLWGINESGWVQNPNVPYAKVAFSSFSDPNLNYVAKTGGPMPFDVIQEQNGNHYDTSTYRFTCPIDGHYMMQAHTIAAGNTDSGYTSFYKNGNRFAMAYNLYRGFTSMTVVKAFAGDYLQLAFSSSLSYYEGPAHTNGIYFYLG